MGCLIMFELDQRIAEQLSTISLNSSVQVRCVKLNAFMVTAAQCATHADVRNGRSIHSASRGAVEIIQAFESIGVDVSNIQFIDLVSSGFLEDGCNQTSISLTAHHA